MTDNHMRFGMFERTGIVLILTGLVAVVFATMRYLMIQEGSTQAISGIALSTYRDVTIWAIMVVMYARPVLGVALPDKFRQNVKQVFSRGQ